MRENARVSGEVARGGGKGDFFPRPSHSPILSRGALARLLETSPNGELVRKLLITAHKEQTVLTVVSASQCLRAILKKNYNVIDSFGWITVFRVKICKLKTFCLIVF